MSNGRAANPTGVSVKTFDGYLNGILTPAILLTPRGCSDSSDYFSEASSSSSTSTPKEKPTLEIPHSILDALAAIGLEVNSESIVTWGSNSAIHPKRWSSRRKIYDSAVICFMQFFMTMMSNVGTSIAPYAAHELGISDEIAIFCFTTLYLFGQALGGLILPPVSESFGGRLIYVGSAFAFVASSFIIAAVPKLPVVVIFRMATGVISAVPAVVAAGTFENMWDIRGRAFVVHLWIAGSVVGLAIGPPVATFISTSSLGWPWVFYIAGFVTVALLFFTLGMRESRPSQILRNTVKSLAHSSNFQNLHLSNECCIPTLAAFTKTSLILPFRLFLTEPIVTLTTILAATASGIVYLFSDALSIVYSTGYNFTPREASLTNLAFAAGVLLTILPRLADAHIMNKRNRAKRAIAPEDKLTGFVIAAPALATGLWIFALTIPPLIPGVTPWVSISALLLVGFAVVEFGTTLMGYLCDSYGAVAASANSPLAFLRAVVSGVLPLAGRRFFGIGASGGLGGPSWAVFVLAGLATGFCAVPVLFVAFGKKLRARSAFAGKLGGTADCEQRERDRDDEDQSV